MSATATRNSDTESSPLAAASPQETEKHYGALEMTRETILKGFGFKDGVFARFVGHDFVRFQIGARRFVALGHPDYVEQVLYSNVDNYIKSVEYEPLTGINGLSIFSDDGESWRRHRMLLNPVFSKRHLSKMFDLMVEPVQAAAADLPSETGVVEFEDLMMKLTLEVVGSAVFSQSFTKYFPNGTGNLIGDGLARTLWFTRVLMMVEPPPPALRAMWRVFNGAPVLPPPFGKLRGYVREVHGVIDAILAEREANPTDATDLLNLVIAARDEEGAITPERVRSETVTAMLAGHETTANATAWTFYCLALNPWARERMIEEIDTVLEGRAPTVDDLPKLEWTTACMLEGMRLFPPVFAVSRKAVHDDIVGGHKIKAGTSVWIPTFAIHRDPRWWPDPELYDPTRFLPGADADRPRSAYLPFIGGRRVCIGRSLSMMETVLILAVFGQTHTFDLLPGHPVEPDTTFTLRPRGGLPMVARPR